jgi:hypothetical protein
MVFFGLLLAISTSYAGGRIHAGLGYRRGYRSGYRAGYGDGDRACWSRVVRASNTPRRLGLKAPRYSVPRHAVTDEIPPVQENAGQHW